MNKFHGSSGLSLLIALAVICFILFYIGPKYLKGNQASLQTEENMSPEKSQKSIPYVDTYHKGMAGARAAVEASHERNKSID